MRLIAARLNHETNTFSPVPTPLAAFAPLHGRDALAAGEAANTAFGAFIAHARAQGAEIATPLAAMANPSGPCAGEVFEALAAPILDAVRQGCDAILLDLHGAMVSDDHFDCEGELLARIRAIAPDVPLGVALDLHGNITARMVENSDCMVGFKTYPHVDMYETGAHVARIVALICAEGLRPRMARAHPPLLAQTLRMNTEEPGIFTDLIAQARAAEAEEAILAVSVFGGFPLADIPEAGVSVVTVAREAATAERVSGGLAAAAWAGREGFLYEAEPLETSLARARDAAKTGCEGPVLLLDHGDNCMSGGTCDTMDVLGAALSAGMGGIVAGPICDPETVARMFDAGAGAQLEIALGNKVAAEGFPPPAAPLALAGEVAHLGDGRYVVSGPIYTGQTCEMGRAAVLRTGGATVLVTELPHEPWDLGVFECAGVDVRAARFLLLKSRMYARPVFCPLARAVIECASSGITAPDLDRFAFRHVARPVFPLDSDAVWGREL